MLINLSNLPIHQDIRGKIQMVIENAQIGSVSIIESLPNTIRANHYHPRDEHTILVLEGQVEYYERLVNTNIKPKQIILNKGDLYHTFCKYEHTMFLPCWTSFLCLSKLSRNTENYELETVRFNYCLRDLFKNG